MYANNQVSPLTPVQTKNLIPVNCKNAFSLIKKEKHVLQSKHVANAYKLIYPESPSLHYYNVYNGEAVFEPISVINRPADQQPIVRSCLNDQYIDKYKQNERLSLRYIGLSMKDDICNKDSPLLSADHTATFCGLLSTHNTGSEPFQGGDFVVLDLPDPMRTHQSSNRSSMENISKRLIHELNPARSYATHKSIHITQEATNTLLRTSEFREFFHNIINQPFEAILENIINEIHNVKPDVDLDAIYTHYYNAHIQNGKTLRVTDEHQILARVKTLWASEATQQHVENAKVELNNTGKYLINSLGLLCVLITANASQPIIGVSQTPFGINQLGDVTLIPNTSGTMLEIITFLKNKQYN